MNCGVKNISRNTLHAGILSPAFYHTSSRAYTHTGVSRLHRLPIVQFCLLAYPLIETRVSTQRRGTAQNTEGMKERWRKRREREREIEREAKDKSPQE